MVNPERAVGIGTVGRMVASDTGGLGLESTIGSQCS